jgi:hypothetical protein
LVSGSLINSVSTMYVVCISSINHRIQDARIPYAAAVNSLTQSIGIRHKMLIKTTDDRQNSVYIIVASSVIT